VKLAAVVLIDIHTLHTPRSRLPHAPLPSGHEQFDRHAAGRWQLLEGRHGSVADEPQPSGGSCQRDEPGILSVEDPESIPSTNVTKRTTA
jgi:hypothetical protein